MIYRLILPVTSPDLTAVHAIYPRKICSILVTLFRLNYRHLNDRLWDIGHSTCWARFLNIISLFGCLRIHVLGAVFLSWLRFVTVKLRFVLLSRDRAVRSRLMHCWTARSKLEINCALLLVLRLKHVSRHIRWLYIWCFVIRSPDRFPESYWLKYFRFGQIQRTTSKKIPVHLIRSGTFPVHRRADCALTGSPSLNANDFIFEMFGHRVIILVSKKHFNSFWYWGQKFIVWSSF
jgi:hypothetical protein